MRGRSLQLPNDHLVCQRCACHFHNKSMLHNDGHRAMGAESHFERTHVHTYTDKHITILQSATWGIAPRSTQKLTPKKKKKRSYTQHPTFLSFDRCLLAHSFSLGPQNLNHSLYTIGSPLLYPQFPHLPHCSEVSISCPQYTISSHIYHTILRPMCAWNSYSSDPYLQQVMGPALAQ